jgi:hypothetical protein
LLELGWHAEHGLPACLPVVMGNPVWLNVPWVQEVSLTRWQLSQVVGNPAAVWLGFVVLV